MGHQEMEIRKAEKNQIETGIQDLEKEQNEIKNLINTNFNNYGDQ